MKSLIYTLLFAFLCVLGAGAQKQSGHNAAISRNLEILNDIYKQLDIFYVDTLDADTVIGWGIRSLLRQVDPFTDYYPQEDEELRQMTTGKYAGIGSAIRYHKKEGRCVITEPFENSPSQRVGLKAGDVIMRIDGKDVKGWGANQVTGLLRGEAGTTFELIVRRGGEEKTLHVTRQTIQTPDVPYYGMIENGIGYICLTGFTDGTCKDVRQALVELKQQGADKMVVSDANGEFEISVPIGEHLIECYKEGHKLTSFPLDGHGTEMRASGSSVVSLSLSGVQSDGKQQQPMVLSTRTLEGTFPRHSSHADSSVCSCTSSSHSACTEHSESLESPRLEQLPLSPSQRADSEISEELLQLFCSSQEWS